MKKLILLLSLIANEGWAFCAPDDIGFGFQRCENKEVICYKSGHGISCFPKLKSK